jgi:hypothetical protein
MTFKNFLARNVINARGFKTKRKIIVIESDDWGFVRKPYPKLKDADANLHVSKMFEVFDSLETHSDLEALFSVLYKFRDSNGNPPVVSPMTVVTNPNFEMMANDNFSSYHFESFLDSFKNNKDSENCLDLYRAGIANKVFVPQYHGREHVNVPMWLNALKNNYSGVIDAAKQGTFPSIVLEDERKYLIRTYNYKNKEEQEFAIASLVEGINIFTEALGYKPEVFMAPAYCWSSEMENALFANGIKYLQSGRVQFIPFFYGGKFNFVRHYTGQRNTLGQLYSVRNVEFEPTIKQYRSECVSEALNQINTAFLWKKPAIIETHRLNYMGTNSELNRKQSLNLLNELLDRIIRKYPNVEFMTSQDLFELMN